MSRWSTFEQYQDEVNLAKKELEKLVLGERENQAWNYYTQYPFPIKFESIFITDNGKFLLTAEVKPL